MLAEIVVFGIVLVTSVGLTAQCIASLKAKRAEYLSFPIAFLIQFPYPMWAVLSWINDDWRLLSISFIMGVPTAWLSLQYFLYEFDSLELKDAENRFTVLLSVLGLFGLIFAAWQWDLSAALAATAAYFTCCISIFSYLLKIWRVNRGQQNLEGLKWATLITLLVFYGSMIYVGKASEVALLSLSYVFSVFALVLAILYKLFREKTRA